MRKTEIERNFLNLIKISTKKHTAYIIFNVNKARMYIVTTAIQYSSGSSSQHIRQEREIKGM